MRFNLHFIVYVVAVMSIAGQARAQESAGSVYLTACYGRLDNRCRRLRKFNHQC
jgi:hypothetical protein